MMLRALAISAPQFVEAGVGDKALSSNDPISLYNACRQAAYMADLGVGAWGDSNWAGGRRNRISAINLLHDLPKSMDVIDDYMEKLQPNVVFIGAMTICLPGAVACARRIKETLGDNVCIVLGGRHANETIYSMPFGAGVGQHVSSPVRLMEEGRIPACFDVVISGDGEFVIAQIGELVARRCMRAEPAEAAKWDIERIVSAPGHWIAGVLVDGEARFLRSAGHPIDYHAMPSPIEMFGTRTAFDTFGNLPTAHVFSDIGQGCIYDCAFCSERISVVGRPRQFASSAYRLFHQLSQAEDIIAADYPDAEGCGAFVEDSTLLGWRLPAVEQLESCYAARPLQVRFGGQATIDQILRNPDHARRLRALGLEYLFIGLETPVPEKIGGMQKDLGAKNGPWMERAEAVISLLARTGIKAGISLLFGLGEAPEDRRIVFDALENWRRAGALDTVSMNWAVQHPLKSQDEGMAYRYLDWAIEPGPMLSLLRHFGEASTRYTPSGGTPPVEEEVREIISRIDDVLGRSPPPAEDAALARATDDIR